MEPRKVADRPLLAVGPLGDTEVLLQVDSELGHHHGVLQVRLHPLQALDALLTGVPEIEMKTLLDFICVSDLLSAMTSQMPMV